MSDLSQEKTQCLQCNKEIDKYQSHFNKEVNKRYWRKDKINKYCSEECAALSKRRRVKRNCVNCNKEFEVMFCSGKKYCNNYCAGKVLNNCKRVQSWESSKKWQINNSNEPHEVECVICDTKFISNKCNRKYCSEICSNRAKWQQAKQRHKSQRKERGLDRKQACINLKGGKCEKCGYNKTVAALTFHHRDPKQKSFELSQSILKQKRWSDIKIELEKCDLVCFNCHMEIHHSTESS